MPSVEPELDGICIVFNPHWAEGLGTSLGLPSEKAPLLESMCRTDTRWTQDHPGRTSW